MREACCGDSSTQRAIAGSEAPINMVGKKAQRADGSAQKDRWQAVSGGSDIDPIDERHAEENQHATETDASFHPCVHAQRMQTARDSDAWQRNASDTQSAHECGEKNGHRYGGRSDGKFEQLVPDDFVDQGRAATGGKKQEKQEKGAGHG